MDRDDEEFPGAERPDGPEGPDGLPLKFQTASNPRPARPGIRVFTWVVLIIVAIAIIGLTVSLLVTMQG